MLLTEKQKLDGGGTVVIDEARNIVQLERLVSYAAEIGRGHVDVIVPIRSSHASRLTAIGGGRYVTIRNASRVVVT